MPRDIELRARDKVTQKMSRDGVVEQNLTQGTENSVSERIAEISFDEADTESGMIEELEFGRGRKSQAEQGSAKRKQHQTVSAQNASGNAPVLNESTQLTGEAYLDSLLAQVGVMPDPRYANRNIGGSQAVSEQTRDKVYELAEAAQKAKAAVQKRTASEVFSENNLSEDNESIRVNSQFRNDSDITAEESSLVLESDNSPLQFSEDNQSALKMTRSSGAQNLTEKAAYKIHIQSKSARQIRNESKTAQSSGALGKKLRFEQVESKEATELVSDAIPGKRKSALISNGPSVVNLAEDQLHQKVHETEDDNLGVQAAHESEIAVENTVKSAASSMQSKAENQKATKRSRLKFDDEALGSDAIGKAPEVVSATEGQSEKAFYFKRKAGRTKSTLITEARQNTELQDKSLKAITTTKDGKEFFGRVPEVGQLKQSAEKAKANAKKMQKNRLKKSYAASFRKASGKQKSGADLVEGTSKAFKQAGSKAKDWLISAVRKNKAPIIILLAIILVIVLIAGSIGSVGTMITQFGNSFVSSTYLSSDDDITNLDADYSAYEDDLQDQIDNIETTHSGYDEYRYQVDEIDHDPYALAAFLTAYYGDYTEDEVSADLITYFREQYTLTLNEVVETRTRTVTGVDPTTGETYSYEEEYDWYVLEVTLDNHGIEAVAMNHLNENQQKLYRTYVSTKGNREYLFGDTEYSSDVSSGGISYEIPPEALEDEAFARMINEGEKYLGRAYVWGGSSPSTGFDCSGFVSWVINHSGNGWDVGRQTANGLMSHCTYVSPSDAQPGDLIFFEHTYNTTGASHVGIYVGNGMMLHCGDPIQYTSINSSYWQSHFLSFGRISD